MMSDKDFLTKEMFVSLILGVVYLLVLIFGLRYIWGFKSEFSEYRARLDAALVEVEETQKDLRAVQSEHSAAEEDLQGALVRVDKLEELLEEQDRLIESLGLQMLQ